MFRTVLTAAALTLFSGHGHASALRTSFPLVAQVLGSVLQQAGHSGAWVTFSDAWSYWVAGWPFI